MGRHSQWKLGWVVPAVAVLVAFALADAATLNKKARLRDGPGKETNLLGWLDEGTIVTTEGQRGGWYIVRTPNGRTGYVWQEHLNLEPSEQIPAGPSSATTSAPASTTLPASPPSTAPVEAHTPPPVERPEANVGAELERLRAELARLATGQQELLQRLNRDGTTTPDDPSSEPAAGPAVIFLVAGAIVGWIVHWLQVRRDRRSRIRL